MESVQRIEAIREALQQSLQPSHLEIFDDSAQHQGHPGAASGAGHFTVEISADKLKDLSRIQQHRLIYQALDHLMPTEIHALQIRVM